jgi:elongation factor G
MKTVLPTPPARWRNLGIIAHIDAGKTTLTERLLWKAGVIHKTGEVHDGAATTDHMDLERERGITIGSAAVEVPWQDHRLTIIDTPGHIDFAIEVERSLRVLDGALAVFCAVSGVQPQSESVWRQARRHHVPLMAFVNKMDREGADFDAVVNQIRTRLHTPVWSVVVPWKNDAEWVGLVNLVDRTVWTWALGQAQESVWTASHQTLFEPMRDTLIEQVAGEDDTLLALWLEGSPVTPDLLQSALRRTTLARRGVAVLAGSAFKNKGIEPLLDAITRFLPSPEDRPAVTALTDSGESLLIGPDMQAPLAALVFKVVNQEHGQQAFVRVYGGILQVGMEVWRSSTGRAQRIGRMSVVEADKNRPVEKAFAGQIVAIQGWKDAITGETLASPGHPLHLEKIVVAPPVLSWRLTPLKNADLLRLGQGLARLAQEDPSFRVGTDTETGETLIWGMGELHLEIMVERLRREHGVEVKTGAPSVAFQERPVGDVDHVLGAVDKQTGGHGQFAKVFIRLEKDETIDVEILDETTGGVIPKAYLSSVEKGIRAGLQEGPLGHPVTNVRVVIVHGQSHAVDSSDMAFARAGTLAVQAALREAGTVLLEPVMDITIETPKVHLGEVMGDIQRRGGMPGEIREEHGVTVLEAKAPLAALAGYTTALRSMTQGRASASMAFGHYAPVQGRGTNPARKM